MGLGISSPRIRAEYHRGQVGWLFLEAGVQVLGTGTLEVRAEVSDLRTTGGNSLLPGGLGGWELGGGTLPSMTVAPEEGEGAGEKSLENSWHPLDLRYWVLLLTKLRASESGLGGSWFSSDSNSQSPQTPTFARPFPNMHLQPCPRAFAWSV